jgi:hypothetical protein
MPLDKPNQVSNDSLATPYITVNSDVAELGKIVATFYSGTTAQRPTVNLIVGDQFYNTQLKQLEIYTDNGWVADSTGPQAPTNVTASNSAIVYGGTPAAIVKWVNATSGSPAATYTVTSTPGSITSTGTSSPITVPGLTGNTAYTFTVTASNTYGSATSSASPSITVGTISQPPTSVLATAGNGTAVVSFTAPSNTGAAPVISYTVTSSPGNVTATGASSPITVPGLPNGTTYTFTVVANNNAGSSVSSTASNAVTPNAFTLGVPLSSTSIYGLMSVPGNLISTAYTPTTGSTLTIAGNSLGNYDYTFFQSSQTVSSFTASNWFTNNADTNAALIWVKGDLIINSGVTFTPPVRKLFTCIYVTGNLVLNGTMSMTARGANHSGTGNSAGYVAPATIVLANGTLSGTTNPNIPSTDGSYKILTGSSSGQSGNNAAAGGTGGGGTGGHGSGGNNNGGAAGTAFSGGPGGGGGYGGGPPPSGMTTGLDSFMAGQGNGARGGNGGDSNSTVTGGGGAGNPGGLAWNSTNYPSDASNSQAQNGQDGTGGTLIVIVEGTISGTGAFTSQGSNGGYAQWISYGGPVNPYNWVEGGGGSGGGSINLLTRTYSFSGSFNVNGGAGGSANSGAFSQSVPGGAGGTGSARTFILTGNPI